MAVREPCFRCTPGGEEGGGECVAPAARPPEMEKNLRKQALALSQIPEGGRAVFSIAGGTPLCHVCLLDQWLIAAWNETGIAWQRVGNRGGIECKQATGGIREAKSKRKAAEPTERSETA